MCRNCIYVRVGVICVCEGDVCVCGGGHMRLWGRGGARGVQFYWAYILSRVYHDSLKCAPRLSQVCVMIVDPTELGLYVYMCLSVETGVVVGSSQKREKPKNMRHNPFIRVA